MKYGTIKRVERYSHGLVTMTDERVVNSATVYHVTTYCESIKIKHESQILAEFLKLQDDKKEGRISSYGLQAIADESGKITRIEKSWTV